MVTESVIPETTTTPAQSTKHVPYFCCPQCKGELQANRDGGLLCPQDDLVFVREKNIWRFLAPERQEYFKQFIQDYETVREREGRWSHDPAFYRSLPYKDLTGRFSDNWQIRAVSYDILTKHVLSPLEQQVGAPLRILDAGAGNAWLSNRLKQLGQWPVALDLSINSSDGLGACIFYREVFVAVQAELDRVPFQNQEFDLVIFNASLHYSEDYEVTLAEALRVLADHGSIVVIDSPLYSDPESGREMVAERGRSFLKEFGFRSDAITSENFLTFDRLDELSERLDVCWSFVKPDYGWKWRMKPWYAKIRGRREAAKFFVIVGKRR